MYRSSTPLNSRHWGQKIEEDHVLHTLQRSILRLSATGNTTVDYVSIYCDLRKQSMLFSTMVYLWWVETTCHASEPHLEKLN